MKYQEFKRLVHDKLLEQPSGITWKQLKDDLPYNQPCPEWARCLEEEIGLVRRKGSGKAFIWLLQRPEKEGARANRSWRASLL